jgi:hypothetical protein
LREAKAAPTCDGSYEDQGIFPIDAGDENAQSLSREGHKIIG